MEIAGCTASEHCQRFINVLRWLVAGNGGSRGIRLFNKVVAVVGEDARGGGRDFLYPAAKRVIGKRYRPTASRQRDARQAVLEVPGVDRRVRPNYFGLSVPVVIEHLSAVHRLGAKLFGRDYPVLSLENQMDERHQK